MSPSPRPVGGRDLRAYARTTQARLIAGAGLLLLVIGGGLIYVFYGPGGAALAAVCLSAAVVPVLLIAAGLWLIDRAVRSDRES